MLIGFLLICIVLLAVALGFSLFRNLQYSDKLEVLGDQIEESLDIIDDCYQRISKAIEVPVLSDEPIVKELLADIKYIHQAVLLVANKIVVFDDDDDDDDE